VSRIADLLGANAENRLALIGSGKGLELTAQGGRSRLLLGILDKAQTSIELLLKAMREGDTRIRLSRRIVYGATICLALRQAPPTATNLPVQESI
jgi:hypothetical protein